MKKTMFILLSAFLVISCGPYVKASNEGKKVRIVESSDDFSKCKLLGGTTVSVLDKVGFIERDEAKVKANLESLAQNSAADMAGDTIVAISEIKNGEQKYDVYRCINP